MMRLLEIFDQPEEFVQSVRSPNHARYNFQVGEKQYFADFQTMGPTLWLFNFFEKTRNARDIMFGGGTPRLTGNAGIKSVLVFSTVIAIMREFAQQYQPDALFIAADASEGARAPLYRRMIQRLLPGAWTPYVTTITRDQDPLRQEREGYVLVRGNLPIAQAARPLERFGISQQQWQPMRA